jgi:hypothetical protein
LLSIGSFANGEKSISLEREALRILELRCGGCHGEDAKAGLRLDRPESWDEDLVVWGRAKESRLWIMVNGQGREIMPPSGKLPKSELKTLRLWIERGRR